MVIKSTKIVLEEEKTRFEINIEDGWIWVFHKDKENDPAAGFYVGTIRKLIELYDKVKKVG